MVGSRVPDSIFFKIIISVKFLNAFNSRPSLLSFVCAFPSIDETLVDFGRKRAFVHLQCTIQEAPAQGRG